MLKELQVKNFAVIDDITVKFGRGLNILSGETGAGKTLIIEAINLLIGERADNELIREGEDKLIVQGFFDLSLSRKSIDFLISENLASEDDDFSDINITREVSRQGKNRAFINGLYTQTGILKNLGKCFLDLHGQHDHQYLLDWQTHIDIIDSFGREKISPVLEEYKSVYNDYANVSRNLNRLTGMQNERERRLEDLKYRADEIEKLKLEENEEEELEQQRNLMRNYEKIYRLSNESLGILNGEDNAPGSLIAGLSVVLKNIDELSSIDKRFEPFLAAIRENYSIAADLDNFLKEYTDNLQFSTEKLDAIQERLYKISEIKRKYNMSVGQLNEYIREIKKEIEGFEMLDSDIEKNRIRLSQLKEKLKTAAVQLSEIRREETDNFALAAAGELKELHFKSAVFEVKRELNPDEDTAFGLEIDGRRVKPSARGIDVIEFLISLNPGEGPRPLAKIASGGEISRIMLSLKSIISGSDNIITMVFDEIDTGIGGATAIIVGGKLHNISKKCQVICITHLPQIAAFADSHFLIDKTVESGRTKIKISLLHQEDVRIKEISRMLSGMTENEISIKHALELLSEINKIKNKKQDEMGEVLKIGN